MYNFTPMYVQHHVQMALLNISHLKKYYNEINIKHTVMQPL